LCLVFSAMTGTAAQQLQSNRDFPPEAACFQG
jgi:hypothetical protein